MIAVQHTPPLARYRDDLLGFARDFTPLKPDQMGDTERRVMAEFQSGHRRALGISAWEPSSLLRAMFISYTVIAWKTLCFDRQLTGIYGKNMRKAIPWINGFRIFVGNSDPLIQNLLQFGAEPRVTVAGDEYWRVVLFNPNESELQSAQSWLTNVVYYDFDRVPEWLIRATQDCVRRDGLDRPVSLSIFCDTKRRNFPSPPEPPPYRDADGSPNADD